MFEWRKCANDGKNCGLVDGNWYILEVKGAKRPLLGRWDEENDRFVGAGLVWRELDEAIPLKSGKVLWVCECPVRKRKEDLESEYRGPFYRSVDEMLGEIGRDDLSLKDPVPSCKTLGQQECCEFYKPINDDPYKNAFDILGYAVLIRLCADILEEAKKYRPNITIDDIINGVNEGKIKLSLYGYDILSPNSGERPKIEFVD